jgi:hypothetical protein
LRLFAILDRLNETATAHRRFEVEELARLLVG